MRFRSHPARCSLAVWIGSSTGKLKRKKCEWSGENQNDGHSDYRHDKVPEKMLEMDATVFSSNRKTARSSPDEDGLQDGHCSQSIKHPEQKKTRLFARELGAEVDTERDCDGGEEESARALFRNRRCGHGIFLPPIVKDEPRLWLARAVREHGS